MMRVHESRVLGEQALVRMKVTIDPPPDLTAEAEHDWAKENVEKQDTQLEREIRELLVRGADANARRPDTGETLLELAAASRATLTAATLIDFGAHTNEKDHEGETPLMCAARNGHPDTVALLLKHGANTRAKDAQGHTALDLARTAFDTLGREDEPTRAEFKRVIEELGHAKPKK